MSLEKDILFAKIILREKWLPKETIEKALAEVKAIKTHDPEQTLANYLGIKEVLSWEKIDAALTSVDQTLSLGGAKGSASGSSNKLKHKTSVPKKHDTHHRKHAGHSRHHGTHHGSHHRTSRSHASHSHGSRSHGSQHKTSHQNHHHHHPPKKKTNSALVGGLALGIGVVLVVVVLIINAGKGPTKNRNGNNNTNNTVSKTGGGPATSAQEEIAFQKVKDAIDDRQKLQRIKAFLAKYPGSRRTDDINKLREAARQSLDSSARIVWAGIKEKIPAWQRDHEFAHIQTQCKVVVRDFPDTQAARDAAQTIAINQTQWDLGFEAAMRELDGLMKEKAYGKGFAAATNLLEWCPEDRKPMVRRKRDDIEAARQSGPVEVAMVDKTDNGDDVDDIPEPLPDPSTDTDTGTGLDGTGGTSESPDPEGLGGLFPGSEEKSPFDKGGNTGDDTDDNKPELVDNGGKSGSDDGNNDDTGTEEKKDGGSGLFDDDAAKDKGPEDNPVAALIKEHGLESVTEKMKRLFNATDFALEKNGRIRLGYAFYRQSGGLVLDWKPSIQDARSQKAKIRWSAPNEGDIMYTVKGIRISEAATFLNKVHFFHDASMEVKYHECSGTGMRPSDHLISGLYDTKNKVWYGVDAGNWAVKAAQNGKLSKVNPRRRDELVGSGKNRWFKMTYKEGKVNAYTAFSTARSGFIITSNDESKYWKVNPTYRKGGELEVTKVPEDFILGMVFYSNIVGTVEYIRMGGFLEPGWFKENKGRVGL